MAKNSEPSMLFFELYESVKQIGVQGVTTILQNSRSGSVTISDEDVDFVIKMVSNHYLIPIEEIISGTNKSLKKRLALGFASYYLNNVFRYTLRELENKLKKDKATLSRVNKWITEELKKKKASHYHDADSLFMIKIETYKTKKLNDGK
jgi:hypothetical protein